MIVAVSIALATAGAVWALGGLVWYCDLAHPWAREDDMSPRIAAFLGGPLVWAVAFLAWLSGRARP